MYKVVVENLNKPSKDYPNKSIAQALIDGTITDKELIAINSSIAFPPNAYNRLGLPEGQYSSQDAMFQFVRTIGPYLSDRSLYELTHRLTNIEVLGGINTQAFRTSTLAKSFMIYELERHAERTEKGKLPDTFLAHMKEFILPLCQKYWPGELEKNVNLFAGFNMSGSLMNPEAVKKYHGINIYNEVIAFDLNSFNPDKLSTLPLKNEVTKFEYQYQKPIEEDLKEPSKLEKKSASSEKTNQISISEPRGFTQATSFFARDTKITKRIEDTLDILSKKIERAKERYKVNKNGLKLVKDKISKFGEKTESEEVKALKNLEQKLKEEIKSNKETLTTLEEAFNKLENKLKGPSSNL